MRGYDSDYLNQPGQAKSLFRLFCAVGYVALSGNGVRKTIYLHGKIFAENFSQ